MNVGILIIFIVLFGYVSNWINWRYLNYRATQYLYYIGALVHESSHALMCLATGARIEEFKVFVDQPHVTYTKSRWSLVSNALIASAPIVGGLLFLGIIDVVVLGQHIGVPVIGNEWWSVVYSPLSLLSSVNMVQWQTWVVCALLINVGAMLGPSLQDLKNMWLVLILLLFVHIPLIERVCILALDLIVVAIALQVIIIGVLRIIVYGMQRYRARHSASAEPLL